MVLCLRLHLVLIAERLLLRECDSLLNWVSMGQSETYNCLLLLRFLLTKLLEGLLLLLGVFLLWRVLLDHI